jgi:hypothetical protein
MITGNVAAAVDLFPDTESISRVPLCAVYPREGKSSEYWGGNKAGCDRVAVPGFPLAII